MENKIIGDSQFTKDSIKFLVSAPEDGSARIKQKSCASIIEKLINNEEKEIVKEEVKFLKDIIEEHKSTKLGGHLLVNNIKLDTYSNNLRDYINACVQEIISESELNDFINIAQIKANSKEIVTALDDLIDKSINIKTETSYSRLLNKFEKLIQKHYLKLSEIKTLDDPTNEMILDPSHIQNTLFTVEKLTNISKSRQKIKTGFIKLDNFLKGGFEPTRIYIFGGKPGIGKSTLLLNLLYFALQKNKFTCKNEKPDLLVYITLENDIVETSERLFSIISQQPVSLQNLSNEELKDIETNISQLPAYLICKYMKPYNTTAMDIFIFLDKLSQNYSIKSVYIDYLNLLKSFNSIYSEKRHELGAITSELKVISKQLQCPIIVPTQLNTAGYTGVPTIRNLDESRQIAQNSDFVGLIFDIPEYVLPPQLTYKYPSSVYSFICINIDKNRNGPKSLYYLLMNREIFTFEELKGPEYVQVESAVQRWIKKSYNENNNNNNYSQKDNGFSYIQKDIDANMVQTSSTTQENSNPYSNLTNIIANNDAFITEV